MDNMGWIVTNRTTDAYTVKWYDNVYVQSISSSLDEISLTSLNTQTSRYELYN